MQIRNYMSTPARTVSPETSVSDALKTMRDAGIRRLPVVDRDGRLTGIVSDKDLLHASPSPATSLSIWEISYLLSKLLVRDVMTREVITVSPETPFEDAAQLMCDRKVGGLPVVESDRVVGVITETDVFRVFTQLLGTGQPGIAVTATADDRPGLLADMTRAIADAGGDVTAIASYPATDGDAPGGAAERTAVFVKVSGVAGSQLVEAVKPFVVRIDEVREP